jgi:hypothetical protein
MGQYFASKGHPLYAKDKEDLVQSGERFMSDYIFAVIIPLVAIAITFAWIPFLNLICPPCNRSLERIALERGEPKGELR